MKTVLLKLSGKVIDDFFMNALWIKVIKDLKSSFDAIVIVHGAGVVISEWSRAFGLTPEFHNGLRVTDEKTMEVVAAVQSGLINGKLVSKLQSAGINSVGLTGIDFNLFTAERTGYNLGFVGIPVSNGQNEIILSLLEKNIIPVFSSICRDEEGNLMNINADTFAKELSLLIKADAVLFLSDINGVKLDNSVKATITEKEIMLGIEKGHITEGMIPKLQNCIELLKNGIDRVWIGKNLAGHNIKDIIFNPSGLEGGNQYSNKGTWVVQSGYTT